jgi:hypothetical protein
MIIGCQMVKHAQDTADKKRTVFTSIPETPYYVGDLWLTSLNDSEGDIKKCIKERLTGDYVASDWALATKYTDNSVANQAIIDAATALEAADGQIQGFFQHNAPVTDMSFGDIWIDTDGHIPPTTADIYRYEDANHGSQGVLAWRNAPSNAIGLLYLNALSNALYIEYSSDSTNWHETFNSVSDIYMRQKIGEYGTWTDAIRIIAQDGVDGINGIDGINSYLHIKYSDYPDGTNMNEIGGKYIGTYTDDSPTDSTDKSKYTWVLIKGDQGDIGSPGADGESNYIHIKYSNDGINFTGNNGEDVGDWIGIYIDDNPIDSNTFSSYQWKKIKGSDGYTPVKGIDYFDGIDGINGVSSYIWIRYSQNADGSNMTTSPINAKYIGVATTTTPDVPEVYTLYNWSLIKGTDGLPGEPGADGSTSYLHIKYSDDGINFTSNNGEDVGAWIGIYVDFTQEDSTNFSSYTWNKIKGTDGIDGTDGINGTSIIWKGTFTVAPSNPENGWAYKNSIDKKSYVYQDNTWYQMTIDGVDGQDGANGTDGLSIIWKGESSLPPSNPQENWVYRDIDNGRVYIYHSNVWELMVLDGSDGSDGTNGSDGLSVFITYHDNGTDNKPSTPVGDGTTNGWHTAPTFQTKWMSQKIAETSSSGIWGDPILIAGGRRFTSEPIPPYDVGDLWLGGVSGDLKTCVVARSSGSYIASDWVLSTKYTDDTKANEAINIANSKIKTFYQDGQPTASEIGDLWVDTNDGNHLYRWNGTNWISIQDSAATNFNDRNDRISVIPANPTVLNDGTAIEHVLNDDSTVDISFKWGFSGFTDAYNIDGFIIYVHSGTSNSLYTFGTNPSSEQVFYISPEKRAFLIYGVPANKYYTIGVQAYRVVDPDIDSNEILKSSIIKSTYSTENPYRPEENVAFKGDIIGTINGIDVDIITDTDPPILTTPTLTNNTDGKAKLTWTKPSDTDLFNYNIWRNTTNNSSTAILIYSTTNINNTTYYDECGVGTYYYWISATDKNNNESDRVATNPSNITVTDITKPDAPTNLVVKGGWGRIDLSWNAPTNKNVQKYKVLVCNDELFGAGTLEYYTNTTNFIDFDRNNRDTRYYRIYAIDILGNESSSYVSGSGSANISSDSVNPEPPTLLPYHGIFNNFLGNIILYFYGSTSNDALLYRIVRHTCTAENRTGDDGGIEIGTISHLGAKSHKFVDNYLEKDKYYYYKIYCIDNSGMISEALELPLLNATPNTKRAVDITPTNAPVFNFEKAQIGAITIGWDSVSDAVIYNVYRYNSDGTGETLIGTTSLLQWTDSSMSVDEIKSYKYKVSALDDWDNESD